jgi:CRISPR system Cascade subunit CasA
MSDPLSVLDTPVFPVRRTFSGGADRLSLAGVIAALLADGVDQLDQTTRLNAPYVHALVCQLAALGLRRSGVVALADAPTDEAAWRALLLALAPAWPGGEAWTLVEADPAKPAFLQPALPAADAARATALEYPEDLSLLVSSRNHGVKQAKSRGVEDWSWIQALIALQTGASFSGRGNPGIARMNGGFGSRPFVSLCPGPRWSDRVRRDVAVMLAHWERTAERAGLTPDGAHPLLWARPEPWGGTAAEMLRVHTLSPHFVEVARRVRLRRRADGTLAAAVVPSDKTRVHPGDAGAEHRGAVGDPWAPLSPRTGGMLTPDESGWTMRRVVDVLFGEGASGGHAALLQRWHEGLDDRDAAAPHWSLRVLVGGQGKTGGWHERDIPIDPGVLDDWLAADRLQDLGEVAHALLGWVGDADGALKAGLLTILERPAWKSARGGGAAVNYRHPEATRWIQGAMETFQARVDAEFFPLLWSLARARNTDRDEGVQADTKWALATIARAVFRETVPVLPLSEGSRVLAEAAGGARLEGILWRKLDLSRPTEDEPSADETEETAP